MFSRTNPAGPTLLVITILFPKGSSIVFKKNDSADQPGNRLVLHFLQKNITVQQLLPSSSVEMSDALLYARKPLLDENPYRTPLLSSTIILVLDLLAILYRFRKPCSESCKLPSFSLISSM